MPRKKVRRADQLSEAEQKVLYDKNIPVDMASIMLDMTESTIRQCRHRKNNIEAFRRASAKYRSKVKAQNLKKFGDLHGCYNYWSEADVEYLMTTTDADKVAAEKLNKTVAAIQKKRERELKKRRKNNGIK